MSKRNIDIGTYIFIQDYKEIVFCKAKQKRAYITYHY